jgi:drug/metabolite transporter (DMT)-like permease
MRDWGMNGWMSLHTKVVLLGLLNAVLVCAGTSFQKLNGVRGGNPVISGWLALSVLCLVPTFFIGNAAYAMGGRMSLFVTATAALYLLAPLVSRVAFEEPLGWVRIAGCVLIALGITVVSLAGDGEDDRRASPTAHQDPG